MNFLSEQYDINFNKIPIYVPLFRFRCVFDSCACDMGGDCECLCTAIAAYAHECNLHGVGVKWRSQELCRKILFYE